MFEKFKNVFESEEAKVEREAEEKRKQDAVRARREKDKLEAKKLLSEFSIHAAKKRLSEGEDPTDSAMLNWEKKNLEDTKSKLDLAKELEKNKPDK
ncbi:MAG: hypothetical protein HYS87_01755 [Candidatus Colwellbacteria bacterium]|nr:hypothetical protein [Candidatus Colwellbacteria bacterium]